MAMSAAGRDAERTTRARPVVTGRASQVRGQGLIRSHLGEKTFFYAAARSRIRMRHAKSYYIDKSHKIKNRNGWRRSDTHSIRRFLRRH